MKNNKIIFSLVILLCLSLSFSAVAANVSGTLESKLQQKGEEADLNFYNDLFLTFKDDMSINDRIKYDMKVKIGYFLTGINPDTLKNGESKSKNLSLDEIKLDYFNTTYQGNIFTYKFQKNMTDNINSYDYLGLIDATTSNEDRDVTTNLDDRDDNTENKRFKVKTAKNGYNFNAATAEYIDGKHLGYLNLKKNFNLFSKGQIGTTAMVHDINGNELDNIAVFGKYDILNNLTLRGEYARLGHGASGEMETAVVTKILEDDKVKFIFDPEVYGVEEKITEVHVVGGDFVTGWNPGDNTISLNDNDGDGIWTETFELGEYGIKEGEEFKFVVNNGGWDKGYGNPTLADPKDENAKVGKDYTIVDKSGNAYLAEMNYKIPKAEKTEFKPVTAKEGTKFRFNFNPDKWGIEEKIKEVHVVCGVNNWQITDKTYSLTEQSNGSWTGVFDLPQGTGFKFVYNNAQDWGADSDQVVGVKIGSDAAELKVTPNQSKPGDYKLNYTLGTKILEEGLDSSLPVAKDDLADKNERIRGYMKYYTRGYYYLSNTDDLKLNLDAVYQTDYDNEDTKNDESENVRHEKIKPGLTWKDPLSGLKKVKTNFMHDKVYDWDLSDRDESIEYRNEYFVETKTDTLGPIDYIKSNARYHQELAMTELFTEVKANVPIKQITLLKVNVDYKANDSVADKPRYFIESKLKHLPFINQVIPYIYGNFESDLSGIKDLDEYGDDNNDWKRKAYADTQINIPGTDLVELKPKVEIKELEEGVTNRITIDDLDEDRDHKYVVDGNYIDFYTIASLEASCELLFGVQGELTLKYDLNHREISEYEDDAIRVKLTKNLSKNTSLEAYYNKQDDDEDDKQFTKLFLKTKF